MTTYTWPKGNSTALASIGQGSIRISCVRTVAMCHNMIAVVSILRYPLHNTTVLSCVVHFNIIGYVLKIKQMVHPCSYFNLLWRVLRQLYHQLGNNKNKPWSEKLSLICERSFCLGTQERLKLSMPTLFPIFNFCSVNCYKIEHSNRIEAHLPLPLFSGLSLCSKLHMDLIITSLPIISRWPEEILLPIRHLIFIWR